MCHLLTFKDGQYRFVTILSCRTLTINPAFIRNIGVTNCNFYSSLLDSIIEYNTLKTLISWPIETCKRYLPIIHFVYREGEMPTILCEQKNVNSDCETRMIQNGYSVLSGIVAIHQENRKNTYANKIRSDGEKIRAINYEYIQKLSSTYFMSLRQETDASKYGGKINECFIYSLTIHFNSPRDIFIDSIRDYPCYLIMFPFNMQQSIINCFKVFTEKSS